jgi:hypothetical protein
MAMRNAITFLLFFSALVMASLNAAGQGYDQGINTAFHPTLSNPAFSVSPLAFDQMYLQVSPDRVHLHAQKNIDVMYTAAGLGAEWRPGYLALMPVAAYHTYFLPSNQHLMAGARAKLEWNENGDTDLSFRAGLLLYSNPGHRHFAGITVHVNETIYSTRDALRRGYHRGFGLQWGQGIVSLARNTKLNTSLFANYYPEESQLSGPADNLFQSQWQWVLWRSNWHYGAGWQQENLSHHQVLFRAGYTRKVSIALAALQSLNFNNNTRLELSIKTTI